MSIETGPEKDPQERKELAELAGNLFSAIGMNDALGTELDIRGRKISLNTDNLFTDVCPEPSFIQAARGFMKMSQQDPDYEVSKDAFVAGVNFYINKYGGQSK